MHTYTTKAYAKVNLRLKVVGRRADGYHVLEMVNSLVDLADDLCVSIEPLGDAQVEISLKDPIGSNAPLSIHDNLASKAAMLFMRSFPDTNSRIKIELTKNIPSGAGLGGGSSNAAAILNLMAEHFRIEKERVKDIALQLGADVPYLLEGGMAFVEGVGEKISRLEAFGDLWKGFSVFLICPDIHLSTKDVFSKVVQFSVSVPIEDVELFDLSALIDNDLIKPASVIAPKMNEILKDLHAIGSDKSVYVGMSGSGSSCFLISDDVELELKLHELFSGRAKIIKTEFLDSLETK